MTMIDTHVRSSMYSMYLTIYKKGQFHILGLDKQKFSA